MSEAGKKASHTRVDFWLQNRHRFQASTISFITPTRIETQSVLLAATKYNPKCQIPTRLLESASFHQSIFFPRVSNVQCSQQLLTSYTRQWGHPCILLAVLQKGFTHCCCFCLWSLLPFLPYVSQKRTKFRPGLFAFSTQEEAGLCIPFACWSSPNRYSSAPSPENANVTLKS